MKKLDAINYFGGQCKLATFLGVPQNNVGSWKRIPNHYQQEIERHTEGALKADACDKKIRYMVTIEKNYIDLLRAMAEAEGATSVDIIRKALKVYKATRVLVDTKAS